MFCHSIKYLYIQLLIFTILLNFAAGCSKHETEPSVAVKYDKNKDVYPDTYFWWKKLIFNSKYFEDKSTGLVNTGTGVHVYILDTGISSLDEEFINAPQKAPTLRDGDFVGDSWGTLYGARDCNGHGTHIAGIVADKNFGIAKNSQIVALRVINCKGVGDVENLLDSISWLYENAIKPAVVLMSLGFGDNSQIRDAVDSSASKGLIFIVSSGQKYSDSCKTAPGGAIRAITVGGYTQALEPLPMNNWGRCIDIFAPGEKIYSLSHLNHELKSKKGSSMAAPFVAGAAAIILSKHKNYNWQDVKKLLLKNSKKDFLILNSGMRLRKTSNRALYIP